MSQVLSWEWSQVKKQDHWTFLIIPIQTSLKTMFFKLTIVNNASLCLNIRTDIMAMFCRFIFYCKQFFWSNDVMFALYRSSLQENKCRMQHIWKNTFVHFSFYRLIYIDCPNTIVMPGPHNSKRLPEGPWEDPLVTRWNEITFS